MKIRTLVLVAVFLTVTAGGAFAQEQEREFIFKDEVALREFSNQNHCGTRGVSSLECTVVPAAEATWDLPPTEILDRTTSVKCQAGTTDAGTKYLSCCLVSVPSPGDWNQNTYEACCTISSVGMWCTGKITVPSTD
jgi:hypothetical protein